ncbi:MAG: Dolichyl-phosphate-mannose-protein mannosyltransferase [Acidobacteriota bacterium]|nr:Dolichyl-phosphate-mannose-protein mannosyltransferase [Acidobacteriota bacterium]
MARLIELDSEGARTLPAAARAPGLAGGLERYVLLVLLVLAAVGFALRASGVGQVGLAEDEINKLEAVRAYERGDFTVNAEHPMVMKALIYASVRAADAWNARASEGDRLRLLDISDEAAVRLPNILFGTLTVFPIFLLTAAFFRTRTGLVAAALWASGVGAITYNRVAKEDTLLVFFMLFALYFYIRAKQTSGFEPKTKKKNYVLSGVAWGLMFASKYFPHYFGLNMLYHYLFHVRTREAGEPRGNTPVVFYVAVFATFLLVNPAVLLPQTWTYLSAYSSEQLLTHHGYLMGETLYHNVVSKAPFGATPVYFYLLYLVTKTPTPVLFAFVVGIVALWRRRREPGAAFLLFMLFFWLAPYSLMGAKWLRYTLSLMPFVYMTAAVGVVALTRWLVELLKAGRSPGLAAWVGAASVALFVGVPAWAAARAAPHYALYTNALGPRPAGYYFPHDELYDDGLREAIQYVADHAPPGATIAHETPGVVRHYLARFGREDLRSQVISDPQFDVTNEPGPVYAILQRGRTYFENQAEMERVRARFKPETQIVIDGIVAAEVYSKR